MHLEQRYQELWSQSIDCFLDRTDLDINKKPQCSFKCQLKELTLRHQNKVYKVYIKYKNITNLEIWVQITWINLWNGLCFVTID